MIHLTKHSIPNIPHIPISPISPISPYTALQYVTCQRELCSRFSSSNFGSGIYLSIRPALLPPPSLDRPMHNRPPSQSSLPTVAPPAPPPPKQPFESLIPIPTHPSPLVSEGGDYDVGDTIPPPVTPPRPNAIPHEPNALTPQLRTQRKNVPVLLRPQADACFLRRLLPRPLPDEIDGLTPDFLQRISHSLQVPHVISCPLHKFQHWSEQYSESLEALHGLWEYDAENAHFIITSMPTAVHESLFSFINFTVVRAIYDHTGSFSMAEACTNAG